MANKKDVRELLILKAVDKFSEKGYIETTIKEIGEAAKVNAALVYYYFKNKNDLLFVIIERSTLRLYEILLEIQKKDIDAIDGLKELITSYVKYTIENLKVTRIINESTDKLSGYQRKQTLLRQRAIYDIFQNQIQKIHADEHMKGFQPEVANLVTMAMVNWCHLWYRKDGRLSLDEVITQMINILFYGIIKE